MYLHWHMYVCLSVCERQKEETLEKCLHPRWCTTFIHTQTNEQQKGGEVRRRCRSKDMDTHLHWHVLNRQNNF